MSTPLGLKSTCPECGERLHFRRTEGESISYFYVCGHLAIVTKGFPIPEETPTEKEGDAPCPETQNAQTAEEPSTKAVAATTVGVTGCNAAAGSVPPGPASGKPRCEVCRDTGFYGDNGPGLKGNREYQICDQCPPNPKSEEPKSPPTISAEAREAAIQIVGNCPAGMSDRQQDRFIEKASKLIDSALATERDKRILAEGLLEEMRAFESIRNGELVQTLAAERAAHEETRKERDDARAGLHPNYIIEENDELRATFQNRISHLQMQLTQARAANEQLEARQERASGVLQKVEAAHTETARLLWESELARERMRSELNWLASYAATVRIDRRDKTRETALQTVDWCEGLIERVQAAEQALSVPLSGALEKVRNAFEITYASWSKQTLMERDEIAFVEEALALLGGRR